MINHVIALINHVTPLINHVTALINHVTPLINHVTPLINHVTPLMFANINLWVRFYLQSPSAPREVRIVSLSVYPDPYHFGDDVELTCRVYSATSYTSFGLKMLVSIFVVVMPTKKKFKGMLILQCLFVSKLSVYMHGFELSKMTIFSYVCNLYLISLPIQIWHINSI